MNTQLISFSRQMVHAAIIAALALGLFADKVFAGCKSGEQGGTCAGTPCNSSNSECVGCSADCFKINRAIPNCKCIQQGCVCRV